MTVHFILLFNKQGKIRLSQWYDVYSQKERARIVRDVHGLVVKRSKRKCNILEWKQYKIIYRRYASLFFAFCVDTDDNELLALEQVHFYVVILDVLFQNVSELDIIFRFDEAFQALHEFMIAGEIQETSKRRLLRIIEHQNQLEDAETGNIDPFGVGGASTRNINTISQVATVAGIPL